VASGSRGFRGRDMKRYSLVTMVSALALTSAATTPVRAGGGDVAAGGNRRPRRRDYYRSRDRRPALLRSTAAGLRCAGAGLLLDARAAGMGWVQRGVDLSCGPSLRVGCPISPAWDRRRWSPSRGYLNGTQQGATGGFLAHPPRRSWCDCFNRLVAKFLQQGGRTRAGRVPARAADAPPASHRRR
jgi:hypothetical protein